MFLITKGERDRESFYLSTFSARIFFFLMAGWTFGAESQSFSHNFPFMTPGLSQHPIKNPQDQGARGTGTVP